MKTQPKQTKPKRIHCKDAAARHRRSPALGGGGSLSEPPSRPSVDWSKKRPHFGPDEAATGQRNVSVELGKTARLTCKVLDLGDKTVSELSQSLSLSFNLCNSRPAGRAPFGRNEQSICALFHQAPKRKQESALESLRGGAET